MWIDSENQKSSSTETGKKHSEYASSYDRRERILAVIEKTRNAPNLTPEEKREIIDDYRKALDSIN